MFERHFPARGICLVRHSFRDSLLDEFVAVASAGLDDQERVLEQLDHYGFECPEVLQERPYWSGIMLRDHGDAAVRSLLERWAAHVHRYSRRDQLSLNIALRLEGLVPDVLDIDNRASWLHTWPHKEGRDPHRAAGDPNGPFVLLARRVRRLERALRRESQLRRQLEVSRTGRMAVTLSEYARRHPRASEAAWRGLEGVRSAAALVRGARAQRVSPSSAPATDGTSVRGAVRASQSADHVHAGSIIYVDPADARGRQLVHHEGDLNPVTLKMWRHLVSTGPWTHVVDVGANYGEMLVNVHLPADAQVIAVEPNPRVLSHLVRTLAGSNRDIRVVSSALAARPGNAELLVDRRWSGRTRLAGTGDTDPGEGFELVDVPVTTLAELLGGADAGPGVRALVKIDVEGGEIGVLQGAMKILDDVAAFAALVEVLHLGPADLAWLLRHFEMQVYDIEEDRFVDVAPRTLERLSAFLMDLRYHAQDVVVRRRAGGPGESSGVGPG